MRAPDHMTLSRRSGCVKVPVAPRVFSGPIRFVTDSTGLKMLRDGEWHNLKHRIPNKRRNWWKLHLAVDGDGFVVAPKLTSSGVDDATAGAATIQEIEVAIERFTADGAQDTRAIYEALAAAGELGMTIVKPPGRRYHRPGPRVGFSPSETPPSKGSRMWAAGSGERRLALINRPAVKTGCTVTSSSLGTGSEQGCRMGSSERPRSRCGCSTG